MHVYLAYDKYILYAYAFFFDKLDSSAYGNKAWVFIPDDPFAMSVRLKFGESSFASIERQLREKQGMRKE